MNARALLLVLLAGCATAPAPVVVKELPKDAAQLELDSLVVKPAPTEAVPYRALPSIEPMKLVVLPVPNKPIVSVRLVFRTGSVDDPSGKEGLTALTTRVLLEGGTKSLDSAQLLQALYPMAAELGGDTDKEFTTLTGRVHRDRLPRFLEIMSETLLAPRFEEKEFTRLRADQLNAVKNRLRQENDEELSKVALDSLLYEGHPYRHANGGTEKGLEAITLEDVKAHWKNTFTQDRLIIGLAGAVTDALATQVKTTLSALPAKGVVRAPLPTAPGPKGLTLIIERDTTSTAGNFGFTTPLRRDSPEFLALFIALSYFGEHRQEHGVLYQEVRERRGLNYGTYAYAQHYRQDGWSSIPRPNILRSQEDVTFWLRPVSPDKAVFATRAVLHFLEQLRSKPIPAERFETARGFLAGATRIWTTTDQRRLGWAIDDVIAGTPDFLGSVRKALETITPAQAQAAVVKYVAPENLNFAFVTKDAAGLAAALKSGAPSPITYSSPKAEDLVRDDAVISKARIPVAVEHVRVLKASDFMVR
ncbi:MAG: pitrilysin family protein [Archangium sp.]|nr:pitrilysin family protein [Archangium sp.]